MFESKKGLFRLFRFAEIDVYLHWWWFLVAFYEVTTRSKIYNSLLWNIAEYITLFGIVLLHEFGHALTCRRFGGSSNTIVLWPLGGVAMIKLPPKPGALLWSVAAGPFVNVLLIPVFVILGRWCHSAGLSQTLPDLTLFIRNVAILNLVLLVFNLLPVYPLDGGQILQALLWFVMGRARSLMTVSVLGGVAAVGLIVLAVVTKSILSGFIALFVLFCCWRGIQQSRILLNILKAPHHDHLSCPSCGVAPPQGDFWICNHCRKPFDTMLNDAVCPSCGASFPTTACPHCHENAPIQAWSGLRRYAPQQ